MAAEHRIYRLRHYYPDRGGGPPVVLVPPMMLAADVYDVASLEQAFATPRTYNTYSKTFVRGLLEQEGATLPAPAEPIARADDGMLGIAAPLVHADLGVYQRVLEAVG